MEAEAEARGGGEVVEARWRRRRVVAGRWRRGDAGAQAAAHRGGGGAPRWRRRRTEVEAASPGGGSLTASRWRSGARRRVGSSADLAKNGQVPRRFEPFFDLWYRLVAETGTKGTLVPVGETNRYQRSAKNCA